MSVIEPGPAGSATLVARVQAILLSPKTEWDRIDTEPATTQGLFTGYAMILAAIPAVAQIIGGLFPVCFFGVCVRHNLLFVIAGAIVTYVIGLVGVFVIALIANELAPSFDGQKNSVQALKLIVYSWTAAWLAGIFAILPALALLSIVGLYSFYLMYVGAPRIMKVPESKALGYTAVTIVIAIVVYLVIAAISGVVVGMGALGAAGLTRMDHSTVSGTLHLGGTNVDLGKLDQAAKQIQAAQNGQPAPAGSVKAVPPETLKALLPAALPAGFSRTESSSSSGGVAGVSGSSAEGVYARGEQKITLQVTDMAAMGALATLGGAVDLQQDRETSTGYQKLGKVDGRMTTEEFDRQTKVGKYSVVVASRFLVEADGEGAEMGDLKGAVSSVGFDRLEGMARG